MITWMKELGERREDNMNESMTERNGIEYHEWHAINSYETKNNAIKCDDWTDSVKGLMQEGKTTNERIHEHVNT